MLRSANFVMLTVAIFGPIATARWSPDGQRLAYIRRRANDVIIETCDLRGANRTMLVAVSKSNFGLADIS